MQFDPSVMGGKAPGDGAALSIALGLYSGNALSQDLHALHPARQAAPGKHGDLDFRHVEPGFHVWGEMELDALQDPASLSRRKGFVEGCRSVGIEVVLYDAHLLGMWVDLVD